MKRKSLFPTTLAVSLAFALGGAFAQGTSGSGSSPAGSAGAGGSAATAPATNAPSMNTPTGSGTAKSSAGKADSAKSSLDRGDRKFVTKAAASGMYEVQISKLAATQASDPAVKSFASMLVDEHTAANNELTQLAGAKGVALPTELPRDKRRTVERLSKLKGAEFDREYMKEVGIKDHKHDIKEFEGASRKVKDPELKAWVTKTLPALQKHLETAQKTPQTTAKKG